MSGYVSLAQHVETMHLLGDENRIRLCALLRDGELCVTDIVRVTGISQSRVSTHLGRLREAGFVRDRRHGPQTFYALASDHLPRTAKAVLDDATASGDPTIEGDQKRLLELHAERRDGLPESMADEVERYYSPGRTWQSLALGLAALLRLGDVLDVGAGDGAAAVSLAPYCRSLTCIDTNPKMIGLMNERMAKCPNVSVRLCDGQDLPFASGSFDAVLVFHTLTYVENPARTIEECARVLRPAGRLAVLCLDEHHQHEVTARYGERHPGFSPPAVTHLLSAAGLEVITAHVACRELKKPHLQVVMSIADKPRRRLNQRARVGHR